MQRFKATTYTFNISALGSVKGAAPNAPERNYLEIQNNGVNPVQVQFGKPAGNVTDIIIGGGDRRIWDYAVPIESINLYSIVGSNGVIIEGRAP